MTRRRRFLTWFIPWVWPLLATAGTIYAVFLLTRHREISGEANARILAAMAVCYLIAAAWVLVRTKRHGGRSCGQIVTYLADAWIYLALSLPRLGYYHKLTESEATLIRSMLIVGGPLLVLSLVLWEARQPHTRGAADEWDGAERRAAGVPGRRVEDWR